MLRISHVLHQTYATLAKTYQKNKFVVLTKKETIREGDVALDGRAASANSPREAVA